MALIISIAIAYLLGSISSAILVSKFLHLEDPRSVGSGNAGATNVLRTSGMKAGILVGVLDIVKGFLAIMIALMMNVHGATLGIVSLAAIVGHRFPVFFGFKGGKGVATAAGTLLVLSCPTFIFLTLTWGLALFLTRYVSLASIIAAVAAPVFLLIGGNYGLFLPFILIGLLIVWSHKDNIDRLRAGTERRISS